MDLDHYSKIFDNSALSSRENSNASLNSRNLKGFRGHTQSQSYNNNNNSSSNRYNNYNSNSNNIQIERSGSFIGRWDNAMMTTSTISASSFPSYGSMSSLGVSDAVFRGAYGAYTGTGMSTGGTSTDKDMDTGDTDNTDNTDNTDKGMDIEGEGDGDSNRYASGNSTNASESNSGF